MNTIKNQILSYLQEKKNWVYGGVIDDFIRQTDGHKASNCSRRCRELVNKGLIDRRLVMLEGIPNKVVQYRYNENHNIPKERTEHFTASDIRVEGRGTLFEMR